VPRVFLKAEWRNLALLTFTADPALLEPYLPRDLELDLWEGQPLLSLVGLQFLNTRILNVPAWTCRDFPEVNLRFYVRRETPEGTRRGVIFVKELVPHRIVSWIARTLYHENYECRDMSTNIRPNGRAEYRWVDHGEENWFGVSALSTPSLPREGSLEEFIIDHHWGYSTAGSTPQLEYYVDRPAWRTFPVEAHRIGIDSERMYGKPLGKALMAKPVSVILAEGSPVSVSFGRKLKGRKPSR
jgi:uncharacterized protein YqjF (DUF2071 family)